MGTVHKIVQIFILIIIVCCSSNQSDVRIQEFERILGERKAEAMNLLVSDFEKNLNKIYPNLSTEEGYKQYMTDIISDTISDTVKFKFQTQKTREEFYESGLWDEVYKFRYSYSLNGKDSTKSMAINYTGKYMHALYAVKNSDTLLKKYWEKREVAGLMQYELVVDGILYHNPDFNDYFHKRIVVMEFSF